LKHGVANRNYNISKYPSTTDTLPTSLIESTVQDYIVLDNYISDNLMSSNTKSMSTNSEAIGPPSNYNFTFDFDSLLSMDIALIATSKSISTNFNSGKISNSVIVEPSILTNESSDNLIPKDSDMITTNTLLSDYIETNIELSDIIASSSSESSSQTLSTTSMDMTLTNPLLFNNDHDQTERRLSEEFKQKPQQVVKELALLEKEISDIEELQLYKEVEAVRIADTEESINIEQSSLKIDKNINIFDDYHILITGLSTFDKDSYENIITVNGGKIIKEISDIQYKNMVIVSYPTSYRRRNYLIGLVYNLPLVHSSWIEDCITNNEILSYDAYLLPQGGSSLFPYYVFKNTQQKNNLIKPKTRSNFGCKIFNGYYFINNASEMWDEIIVACGGIIIDCGENISEFTHRNKKIDPSKIKNNIDYILLDSQIQNEDNDQNNKQSIQYCYGKLNRKNNRAISLWNVTNSCKVSVEWLVQCIQLGYRIDVGDCDIFLPNSDKTNPYSIKKDKEPRYMKYDLICYSDNNDNNNNNNNDNDNYNIDNNNDNYNIDTNNNRYHIGQIIKFIVTKSRNNEIIKASIKQLEVINNYNDNAQKIQYKNKELSISSKKYIDINVNNIIKKIVVMKKSDLYKLEYPKYDNDIYYYSELCKSNFSISQMEKHSSC
jgi:hypothetical protein